MVVVAFGAAVLAAALYVAVVLLRGAAAKPTFSREYRQNVTMANPYWRELRRNTFALTRGRDVLLPFLRAEQLDHLRYRRDGRDIFGYERPIRDVVPLSRFTHAIVTLLRRGGLRREVNSVLMCSFVLWFRVMPMLALALLLYGLALLLAVAGILKGVPAPQWHVPRVTIADGIAHARAALRACHPF
jgi:hypothetical protein